MAQNFYIITIQKLYSDFTQFLPADFARYTALSIRLNAELRSSSEQIFVMPILQVILPTLAK